MKRLKGKLLNSRSAVRAGVLYLLLSVAAPAFGGPINSNSAFSPHRGEIIWREQVRLLRATGDPSAMDRDLRVLAVPSVFIRGLTERWTAIVVVPYLDKSMEFSTDDGRRERGDRGLGDIRTLIKYRVYTINKPGESHRLGVFGGVEWPSGQNDEKDDLGRLPPPLQLGSGSYDPIFGAVWTTQKFAWELDADLGYKVNTAADDFEFGDELFANVSFQYRAWPRTLPDEGVPSFFYAVLELNGISIGRNESKGARDINSGGATVYLSPGIQWVSVRWVLEATVQFPVVQDLNGTALEKDFVFGSGFRFRF